MNLKWGVWFIDYSKHGGRPKQIFPKNCAQFFVLPCVWMGLLPFIAILIPERMRSRSSSGRHHIGRVRHFFYLPVAHVGRGWVGEWVSIEQGHPFSLTLPVGKLSLSESQWKPEVVADFWRQKYRAESERGTNNDAGHTGSHIGPLYRDPIKVITTSLSMAFWLISFEHALERKCYFDKIFITGYHFVNLPVAKISSK